MKGCLVRAKTDKKGLPKGHHTFNIILSLGRQDGKYKQRWVRFHGTKQDAEAKLTEHVGEVHKGDVVEPSKITVGEWLSHWLETAIRPRCTQNTYDSYLNTIENHLKPALGHLPLQRLTSTHIERYYAGATLSASTRTVHHAVLAGALKAACGSRRLLRVNPAEDVINKPRRPKIHQDVLANVWTVGEASTFLTTAKSSTTQYKVFFALALDSGARKGELLGLQWRDIEGNKIQIERQMLKGGAEPVFGPPKGKLARSFDLSDETVALLAEHKREQAKLKMANRTSYQDHGLVFAQAWENKSSKHSVLGMPLNAMGLNTQLERLAKEAGVKRITVHGLRHTCATLLLAAGVPANVVRGGWAMRMWP